MKRHDLKDLFINKFGMLLVPIVVWNTCAAVLSFAVKGSVSISRYVQALSGLWFLWATLWCSLIVTGIYIVMKKGSTAAVLLVVPLLHFCPFDYCNAAYMYPFFIIGFYLDNIRRVLGKWRAIGEYACVFIFAVSLYFWDVKYNVWNAGSYLLENTAFTVAAVLFRFLIGLAGMVAMKKVFDVLYQHLPKVRNGIAAVGRNTLAIYCMQSIVVERLLKEMSVRAYRLLGYSEENMCSKSGGAKL